ncbi:MAG: glutaredoxin family protein [Chloroflexota bacterium]
MDIARLTMYTTAYCGQCFSVKRWLKEWRVAYDEIDITEDQPAQAFVREAARGYLSVPTLRFPDGTILVEPSRNVLRRALGLEV